MSKTERNRSPNGNTHRRTPAVFQKSSPTRQRRQFLECHTPRAEMTTDQDLPIDGHSTTAVFIAKGIDLTPNKDQGVIKIVKRPGQAGDQPMIGDKVTVHYTGRLLNGKRFDCTQDRKEPFTFNVGKGQVLKAWDVGVLSMERGEESIFLCAPQYAYGVGGNPAKIPHNSAVVFEIKLLNFEGEALTTDRGVIRRIKVKGDGFSNPNEGANVHVHLRGTCCGRLFDCRDVSFVVGEAEDKGVPFGVDRAMDKMQKGECCQLYLKPKYAFGSEGKPEFKIGPEKDVEYEVTLRDFQRAKEFWEMDLKEKLELAAKVKLKGNQYFKAGQHFQAVNQYQRIISWLEMECGAGLEEQEIIQDFLLKSHLNLALCYLRMEEFSHVVENCNKVIELDEHNEKALYRRGEARLLRNEFSLAMTDFQQVLHINPSNRAARAQITVCQVKIKEHHEQDKRTYANMFQKFAERDAKTGKRKKRKSGVNGEIILKRHRRSQECCS